MNNQNEYATNEIDIVIQMLKEDLRLAVTKEERREIKAQIDFFKQERFAS